MPRGALAAELHVLLIGDSHVEGTYGGELDRLLRALPSSRVAIYGVGGSIPRWYLAGTQSPWGFFSKSEEGVVVRAEKQRTPRLVDLLGQHRPRWVIVSLGTNFIWGERDTMRSSVSALVQLIRDSRSDCAWIGPPGLGPRYQRMAAEVTVELQRVLLGLPCRWVDSQALVEFPSGVPGADGIHYDSAGEEGQRRARSWARAAYEALFQFIRGEMNGR